MNLDGQRLAVLGFGVENQALGAWLASRGCSFTVCDRRPESRVIDPAWDGSVTQWRLGEAALADLTDFDILFRSPGITARRPELTAAVRAGVRLSSGTELFLAHCPAPVIAVTGTKGKGTTASLLMSILDAAGVAARIGGNIGLPPVTFLDELGVHDLVVLELSSFQLQDLGASPHGAVLLPVATDHLDYHESRSEYVEAKGEICRHQRSDDWVLAAAGCATAEQLAARSKGRQLTFGGRPPGLGGGCWIEDGQVWWRDGEPEAKVVASLSDVRLRGDHNHDNACAAVAAALLAAVPVEAVPKGLQAFTGLPHRLEQIGVRDDVLYVNDSLATTPESAAAGLRAWPGQRVILIAGGSSKGADFEPLGIAIAATAAALVTIGEEGPAIARAARAAGFTGPIDEDCVSMARAVAAAVAKAQAGDVVLLSPACASFGMFASYAERGDAFRQAALNR